MFDNIGGKLKAIAYNLVILSIVAGVIGVIIAFCALADFEEDIGFPVLLISIITTVIAVISTYPLYALGQLVENSDKIVELLSKENKEVQNVPANEQSVSNTETTLLNEANSMNTADTNFAAPTNPAPTMNPVVSNMTSPMVNQNIVMNQPAVAPSDLKIFTCPWCGSRYRARTHRVICPSCHKKID